jgi:hypothetical protein
MGVTSKPGQQLVARPLLQDYISVLNLDVHLSMAFFRESSSPWLMGWIVDRP